MACIGDCDNNGSVTVDELLAGVQIALGTARSDTCPAFVVNAEGIVTVDGLLAAGNNALGSCNTPPVVPCFDTYRGYSSREIRMPITATDADGDHIRYSAANLPAGAQLDAQTGVLAWTPSQQQIGPWYIPVTVTDDGAPPAATQRLLPFEVAFLDACSQPSQCNPATGCITRLPPLTSNCCAGPLPIRPPQPLATCPYGRAVFVGRNTSGFGRLQNCDSLQIENFMQQSAATVLSFQVRCLNIAKPIAIQVRLEIKTRPLFDSQQMVTLQPRDNGYGQILGLIFDLTAEGPFHDIDPGPEANLSVTATDLDGNTATERVRVLLTYSDLNDLPQAVDVPSPADTCPVSTPLAASSEAAVQ